ncbi:MAG: hypothetical protein DYG88_17090 [Chloroflexi bacterium CFX4]|nr:hypothetical protein [Chloroflexi bacterium CFX4]
MRVSLSGWRVTDKAAEFVKVGLGSLALLERAALPTLDEVLNGHAELTCKAGWCAGEYSASAACFQPSL